jgi:hypothetical protein
MRSRLAEARLGRKILAGSGFEQLDPGKSQHDLDDASVILASAGSIPENASLSRQAPA